MKNESEKRLRVEELHAVRLCLETKGYELEEAVIRCLDDPDPTEIGLAINRMERAPDSHKRIAQLLSRCLVFCVDGPNLLNLVVQERGERSLPPLPPLPAKWIAIQDQANDCIHAVDVDSVAETKGLAGRARIFVKIIIELERGRRWRVISLGLGEDVRIAGESFSYLPLLSGMDMTSEGQRVIAGPRNGLFIPFDEQISDTARVTVDAVHLITARSVRAIPAEPLDRPERRRLQRSLAGETLPRIYWLEVGEGESERHDSDGTDNRTFRCRWLVRGHWRNLSTGNRSWVNAYVKGPVGAPWKGRPVYAAAGGIE